MSFYIVSTPIGNLKDITHRAIETLKEVDLILAEDTRVTKRLLQAYDIHTRCESYHAQSSPAKEESVRELIATKNVALVSDAGTPGISDPGAKLIAYARDNDIEVIPIPGASALLTALVGSGCFMDTFQFWGFIPHKKGRQTFLKKLKDTEETVVFYESTHRIEKLLDQAEEQDFGDRLWCIARELTKIHETWYRGTLSEIRSMNIMPKGEFVVVVNRK
jgi:16S rRNA (cytidine1402-2'-O)-methyltransferase